jgi:hypothetical protein
MIQRQIDWNVLYGKALRLGEAYRTYNLSEYTLTMKEHGLRVK